MCEEEYRAKMKCILEGSGIPCLEDIIENKVAECKGESLCSILSLEDVFEIDIERMAKGKS